MAKLYKFVEDHKADKGLRLLNYIIDLALAYAVVFIFFIMVGVVMAITSDSMEDEDFEILGDINPLIDRLITLISYALLMFLIEAVTKGRSVGKYITGTMVVRTDGTALTTSDYFIRNICRAIPFDQLSFLGNNGWHDSIHDTKVVNKKNYEEALRMKNDLDNLGNAVKY